MRPRLLGAAVAATITVALSLPAIAGASPAPTSATGTASITTPSPLALLLARQALPANDGWAADGTGTKGGSAAATDHVFVAHNRSELIAALGGNNGTNATNATPKIVFVSGSIDANVDDNNQPLSCPSYADPAYSLDAFLATYDPAVWGRTAKPSGPLEDARVRSSRNQAARNKINVGPNTTIFGLGHASITGANLILSNVDNVIIRNIEFQDAFDCFPAWDPTDGSQGNWNSAYDNISLLGATHVWVDHNTFDDGDNPDGSQPFYFGRQFQVHDGLLDITRASDLVTASFNYLHDHDKTMLIGSSDTATADVGHLRVTLHDNRFADLGQRVPRVRFGQVDVYNNFYQITADSGPFAVDGYGYSWGVGKSSAIVAENNFVSLSSDVRPDLVVHYWGGTVMTEKGTLLLAGGRLTETSLLAAYNAAHDPDIGADAGWTPTLRTTVVRAAVVPVLVTLAAGSGRLPT
jgi:pectate lyase